MTSRAAHYDPMIQTQFHTGDFSGAVAHSALLQSFGIVLYIPILMLLLYIVGITLLGIIILLRDSKRIKYPLLWVERKR